MSVTLATTIADRGAGVMEHTDRTHFDELFDGVDDLIKRVADVESPEILRVRARVHAALVAAKDAFAHCANHVRARPAAIAEGVQDEDDRLPTEELGVALLLGLGLALVAESRQY